MKSLLILTVLSAALLSPAAAQNLVRNGDFEDYILPQGTLFEELVYDWASYFTTPDYYNTELMDTAVMIGHYGSLPRSGKGMAGGYVLGYFPLIGYNREFIQGNLSEPLKADQLYYVEMYVKPMLKSPIINYGIRTIGIAVTDRHYTHMDSLTEFMINETPVAEYSAGAITNPDEWTKVSTCFRAKGGETKIIIGNFKKDQDSDSTLLPGSFGEEIYHYGMSYYLFDDVLLKEMPVAAVQPADTVICLDSTITLTAYPAGAASYKWSTGDTTAAIVIEKGTVKVSIETEEGCLLEATASVRTRYCGPGCLSLFMPNAFSPNGDGANDIFRPMNPDDITGLDFSIYNRWGTRVFYTNTLAGGWSGTYHDQPCEVGTYFYQVRYRDCEQQEHTQKGDLVLIR